MVSRAQDLPVRRNAPASAAGRPAVARPQLLTGRQRWFFVLALLVFGVASMYASVAMLARITPALFPGKALDIPFIQPALASLPGPVGVKSPGEGSVFNQRINLLVIGVDRRANVGDTLESTAYNTDTLMVATIDPLTNEIALISFPRDLYIDINIPGEGTYEDRINASYAAGFLRGGNSVDAGARQLMRDMELNFGVKLDHWVIIDFEGVETLIDTIGGIDIEVPEELAFYDWWYSDDDENATYVTIPPGPQHLMGYDAVAFGRNRNDSDLNRVKRQGLVVETALRQVFKKGILSQNPFDLWDAYTKLAIHNVPINKWPGYLALLRDSAGNMKTYSVADPVNGRNTVEGIMTDDGKAVLLWDRENVNYWINTAFTKSQYARSVVEIQDGYGGDGAHSQALGVYLKYEKYLPVVDLGPFVDVRPATEIVLYSENRRPMAEDIAAWLGLSPSIIRVEARTLDSQPDVLIVIGEDFIIPEDG